MPIVLKEQGNFTPVPEGTHPAICFRLVDVGVQPDSGFGERHKLVISWELPSLPMKMDDGTIKPMGVSKTYSFSLNAKSNLRQDLVRWRGRDFTAEQLKGFQLNAVLGKPCQLAIIKSDKGNSKIDGVFAFPKGLAAPTQYNPSVEYSLDQGKDKVYAALPEWIRKMVDCGLLKAAEQSAAEPVEPDEHIPEAPEEGVDTVPF